MKAGFIKRDITPHFGVPLSGAGPAWTRPCTHVLDPINLRALWLSDCGVDVLIVAFDWCFVGREEADHLKAAVGRATGLTQDRILLSATHTHGGPICGSYYDLEYNPPARDYLRDTEATVIDAALRARAECKDVTVRIVKGKSTIPLNRRQKRDGTIVNAPNPGGPILDSLPVIRFDGADGKPVCALFSISTHPVAVRGQGCSADYPGLAMETLDHEFGVTCAMFLQGAAGDSRPKHLARGKDWEWASTHEHAKQTAAELVKEVRETLAKPMTVVKPLLRTALTEVRFLLVTLPRKQYEAITSKADPRNSTDLQVKWAQRMLDRDNLGRRIDAMPMQIQAVQIGEGLRLVALECEPLCAHGYAIERLFADGMTVAVGYSNGEGIYLVTSDMLDEGGYESISYWEFGYPGPLAKGIEGVLALGFDEIKRQGIT